MAAPIRPQPPLVVVTGLRRGLGRAVALARAARGDRVAGFARRVDGLDHLGIDLRRAGAPTVRLAALDIADAPEVENWFVQLAAAEGPPDVVVHAAAVLGPRGPLAEVTPAAWAEVTRVNVDGAFHVLRAAASVLEPGRPFLWIGVTSSVGARGRAGWGPYAASKAALENLTETFADEGAAQGWTAVSVNPGGTRTDMRAAAYPDEDPTTVPAPATVAGAFDLLIDRWRVGGIKTGARFEARELLAETT